MLKILSKKYIINYQLSSLQNLHSHWQQQFNPSTETFQSSIFINRKKTKTKTEN